MRAADLINNGKFNYGAFNGIPKYKQDVLIALHRNFLERYSGFKFTFSDKGFRVLNGDDKQECYCKHHFNGGASIGGASTNYIAICIHTYTCF